MCFDFDLKIRGRSFNEGPPFISRQRADEYLWFEEFEKYGNWGIGSAMTNPDVMSVDWCHDSANVFVSCTANGQICIWDRRSRSVKKKASLWTWGTSHNQSVTLSIQSRFHFFLFSFLIMIESTDLI